MTLPPLRPRSAALFLAVLALLLLPPVARQTGPFAPATARAQAEPGMPAPELDGGVGWINTTRPLHLRDLRGKFVVLDFWTLC